MHPKKNIWFLFLIIMVLVPSLLLAEMDKDSLLAVIDGEHNIERKAELFHLLSKEVQSSDAAEAEKFARQALLLAQKSDNTELIGSIHFHLGDLAFMQDSLPRAEAEYLLAIPYLIESENYKMLAFTYLNIGNQYVEVANYPLAMQYYINAKEVAEKTGLTQLMPNIYNNLGVVYLNMSKYKKALDFYSRALPLFEELKDTMNVAGATTNIGSIYTHMEEYDIARQYYLKGYDIFKSINLLRGQAHVLFKLGLLDHTQQRYDDALDKLKQSKQIQEMIKPTTLGSKSLFLAETNIHIGISLYELGKHDQSLDLLMQGLRVAIESGQKAMIAQASEYVSKIYQQKGDFEQALNYYIDYNLYSDSTFNEENIRKLTQIELQHQFDVTLKEAEITHLEERQRRKRQNLIYIGIVISLVLILIIVGLFLRLENNKKKELDVERKMLEDKLEFTNKELTTHVIYLLKKNEFILTIIEKLKRARLDAKPENKKVMAELIAELQSNTDSVTWEEFEVRFQQVHTDFYAKLNQQFPDLSPNETRMCAFFKLGMTSKEIAALTYQSLNSIKVARYRLRKKLRLEKQESLVSFLTKF